MSDLTAGVIIALAALALFGVICALGAMANGCEVKQAETDHILDCAERVARSRR